MDEPGPKLWATGAGRVVRGISFQLMALLSLALLPIGAISVSLSLNVAREARQSQDARLLGLTKQSASVEHQLISTGLGAELTAVLAAIKSPAAAAECSQSLENFVAGQSLFTFVRFVGADGTSRCASDGVGQDQSPGADVRPFRPELGPVVDRFDPQTKGKVPVFVVTQPVRDGAAVLGYLQLAVPAIPATLVEDKAGGPGPEEVVVLNAQGSVLASTSGFDGAAQRLPALDRVVELLNGPDGVFDRADGTGKAFRFVKVTLIPETLAAIGVLPLDVITTGTNGTLLKALFFPTVIWAFSLLAAFYGARRMVISPIQNLQGQMRRFALGHRNPSIALPPGAALEIQDVAATFSKLAQIVARNEAALALTAEGKLLLLREVHHRIKNNLQMISSIISIQRRKTADEDVRLVLRRLQDRVLSIAAVDQSLYLNGDIWDVRADVLIASIIDRLISVNLEPGHTIKVTTDYEATTLHADQIGALSLLANETVTNALKYVGSPKDGQAFVDIRLMWEGDLVVFTVRNSVGPDWRDPEDTPESSGLGTPLIRAFCDQLAADCQLGPNVADHTFTMAVRFRPSGLTMLNPPQAAAG